MQQITFGVSSKMISILCPTRNRVDSFVRMYRSAMDTATNPDLLEFVICIDIDDVESRTKICGENITRIISPFGEIYSNLHNLCAAKAKYDILMGAADDIVFRTDGWDREVIAIFNGLQNGIGYVYPNDGFHGEKLGTHGFFHKNWFNTLGYLSPPIFTVDYSDNYIMDVAKGVDRCIYLPHVLVEHLHWTFGKSPFDATSAEAHIRRMAASNQSIYDNSKNLISNDIEKLKAII